MLDRHDQLPRADRGHGRAPGLQPRLFQVELLGSYARRMSEVKSIIGRWRIAEMDNRDQEAVDLVQPGFIEFDDNGLGGLGFIVVTGRSPRGPRPRMS